MARYEAGPIRPDPVSILEKQNEARVQKLVPVRYARMLTSPFTFLRGSAAVMASDLSTTPASGMMVAACGDMHVSNFGVYASAERSLIFAINDFDEVHPGPWEWDLKRLAASAAVPVRFMGADKVEAEEAAQQTVRGSACAAMPRCPTCRSGTSGSTSVPSLTQSKSGDPAMIAGYCGNAAALDEAFGNFAMAYVEQTEQDHAALTKARRLGRIKVAASSVVK